MNASDLSELDVHEGMQAIKKMPRPVGGEFHYAFFVCRNTRFGYVRLDRDMNVSRGYRSEK